MYDLTTGKRLIETNQSSFFSKKDMKLPVRRKKIQSLEHVYIWRPAIHNYQNDLSDWKHCSFQTACFVIVGPHVSIFFSVYSKYRDLNFLPYFSLPICFASS